VNRVKTSVGHLSLVQLKPDREGNLGDAAILRLGSAINGVISLMNGGLRLGDGSANSEAGNLSGVLLDITFPSVANTEIEMPHDLGRVPIAALVFWKDRACDVYSGRGASKAWGTESRAFFKCTVASARVILCIA
jgi:hypothetical protein